MSILEASLVKHQKRRHKKEGLHGELIQVKPPTFDGENKRGEEVESCLLGMRR